MHIDFNENVDITVYACFHKKVYYESYDEKVELVDIEDICDCVSLARCSINKMIHKQDKATHINNPYLFDRTIENGVITFTAKRAKEVTHSYWYEKVKLELCSSEKHF